MSNRRTAPKRRGKVPRRAPADVLVEGEASPSTELSWLQRIDWLSLVKILVGVLLVISTASVLAWGAHRYALTTPRFAIDEIVVEGTRRLTREQVLSLSGVQSGDNIFQVDLEEVEVALLENPWVLSARVLRRLPGSLRIELTERVPQALLVLGGHTFLVSEDAEPFKRLEPGDPHDFPSITGLDLDAWARNRPAEQARLVEALGLLNAYERVPLSQAYPAEELHLDSLGFAILTVGSEGIALHLGASPWREKLARAVQVIQKTQAAGGRPGVIFLDNEAHPERVVVRVK